VADLLVEAVDEGLGWHGALLYPLGAPNEAHLQTEEAVLPEQPAL
jgi:hypothetical protein